MYRELNIYVTGIKKRQRKVKKHSFKSNLTFNEMLTDDDLIKARNECKELVFANMREFNNNCRMQMLLKEDVKVENGFTITSFKMFDDRHHYENLIIKR